MALCHSQLCALGYMPLVCYENGAKPCRAQSWGPWQHSKAEQVGCGSRLAGYTLSTGETKGQQPASLWGRYLFYEALAPIPGNCHDETLKYQLAL